jgi:hypothetical protein
MRFTSSHILSLFVVAHLGRYKCHCFLSPSDRRSTSAKRFSAPKLFYTFHLLFPSLLTHTAQSEQNNGRPALSFAVSSVPSYGKNALDHSLPCNQLLQLGCGRVQLHTDPPVF